MKRGGNYWIYLYQNNTHGDHWKEAVETDLKNLTLGILRGGVCAQGLVSGKLGRIGSRVQPNSLLWKDNNKTQARAL